MSKHRYQKSTLLLPKTIKAGRPPGPRAPHVVIDKDGNTWLVALPKYYRLISLKDGKMTYLATDTIPDRTQELPPEEKGASKQSVWTINKKFVVCNVTEDFKSGIEFQRHQGQKAEK